MESMKKPVIVIIAVFAGLILLCCGGSAIFLPGLIKKASTEFKEAEAFGTSTSLAFATSWNPHDLESRATPELATTLRDPATSQIVSSFQTTYGSYRSGTSSVTGFDTKTEPGTGTITYVTYSNNATFEKSSGEIKMNLVKKGSGSWQVAGFSMGGISLGKMSTK